MANTVLFILFFVGFIILTYSIIVLFKRKEYENNRIFNGYNVLILGLIILALNTLVKTIKFGFLSFNEEGIMDLLLYFDIATNLVLIPLFVISYFVSMMLFKEI